MRIFTCLVLLFSLAGTSAFADSISEREGWRVIPTSKSYSDLVEDLKAAVKAEKMLLVTQASASAGAKGRGITIPGNRIIGVYRNDYALRMLDASVAAGIEAPIRFYVTGNSDGSATLSWKTPSFVFAPYMDEGGEALSELASELDLVFLTIAEQAVSSR
ncbi:DUF302 domain-containing protein [Roseibium sp. SCP14]|uniref:DUF302 domain-containing protein n=1 Tax=Roseibium sp. SCP14 TaxID=3141375 RepID=UPI00333708A9